MQIFKRIKEKMAFNALGVKDYGKASMYFKRVLDAYPDAVGVHYNYAISLIGMKQYDQAEKHLRLEISLSGESYQTTRTLGEILYINKKPEAARAYLRKALASVPGVKDRFLLEWKINTLDSTEQYNEMLKGHALFEQGVLLMEGQHWNAARDAFLAALRSDPYNPLLYNNLGVIFMNHDKKYREARSFFENGLRYSDLAVLRTNLEKTSWYVDRETLSD